MLAASRSKSYPLLKYGKFTVRWFRCSTARLIRSSRLVSVPAACSSQQWAVIKNHPFHNGNKRTALVCLLVHLDRNKLIFREHVNHVDVYEFVKRIAEAPGARVFDGSPTA